MKFWVKIVVALCVVLVAAFAVWAFVFRKKDEVVAFSEVSELLEYKESTGFVVKLEKLEKMNYYGEDPSKVIEGEFSAISGINKVRDKCLSHDTIKVYDDGNSFLFEYNSYLTIDEYVNEFMEYMLPYLNNIEGSGSLLRKLKKSKKQYVSALKNTIESLDLVIDGQNKADGSEMSFDALFAKYNAFGDKFRALLSTSADVMSYTLSYYKSAKGGEILTNTYTALNDSFTRTLKTMTTVGLDANIYLEEIDYANDLFYVTSKIDKVKNNENIFGDEFSELNYLNAYNSLLNKNPDVLDTVFSKKYIEKKQMADNQNLTEVPDGLHHNVVVILNVLGY